MTQQSGKWQGKERIIAVGHYFDGQFTCLRWLPFASIMISGQISAVRKCRESKEGGYHRRCGAFVLANTLLREGRDWQPVRP
jgi:hypothetical protein